jgi:hypothetical protein
MKTFYEVFNVDIFFIYVTIVPYNLRAFRGSDVEEYFVESADYETKERQPSPNEYLRHKMFVGL